MTQCPDGWQAFQPGIKARQPGHHVPMGVDKFRTFYHGNDRQRACDKQFLLSDFRTWLPFLEFLNSWGIIPLLAVFLSQLACYFWPEDSSINNLERFMARIAIFASMGYLLLIPMYITTYISTGQAGVPVIAMSCFRCFALSLGFIGASRTRNSKGSPFLRNSVQSPIDYWFKGEFDKY